MFMSDILQQDLKKFIEVFWKRDDIDIRDFNIYKGFAYILMQMYKKPDYQDQKNELMSYTASPAMRATVRMVPSAGFITAL